MKIKELTVTDWLTFLSLPGRPCSLVVRAFATGCGRPGFDPRPWHTLNIQTGRFVLLSLALTTNEIATDWLARSQHNGLSDLFLLTCGRIELVAWHPKIVSHSSWPKQDTCRSKLTYHAYNCRQFTCMLHRIQFAIVLYSKADFKPDSLHPLPPLSLPLPPPSRLNVLLLKSYPGRSVHRGVDLIWEHLVLSGLSLLSLSLQAVNKKINKYKNIFPTTYMFVFNCHFIVIFNTR